MASIKGLKKDIDYLAFAVVDDCIGCLAMGKSQDDISVILQQVIDTRNEMRLRVNAGKKMDKVAKKAHYRSISKDLLTTIDGTCNQLSELVKKG